MKNTAWLFLFLIASVSGIAQTTTSSSPADSLKNALSRAQSDTARVLLLESLTRCYTSIDLDSALNYGRQAMALASGIGYMKGKISSALSTGYVLSRTNDLAEALRLLFEAKQMSERRHFHNYQAIALTSIASVYARTKEYGRALGYLREARAIQEKYDIPEAEVPVSLSFGTLYLNRGEVDSAAYYLKKSYYLGEKMHIPTYLAASTYHLGEVFSQKDQPDSALYYYKKSIGLSLRYHVKYTITRAYQGVAEIFMERNQLDSTIYYCNKALSEQQADAFSLLTIRNANNLLSRVYEKKGQLGEALRYYKQAYAASDSLNSRENAKQIEKLKYEEQEQESRFQRRIEANEKAFLNQALVYALSGIVVIILIIALILHRNNRQKKEANLLLEQQKNEIETEKSKADAALLNLKSTQAQLIQAEKMASLGELTAGIAHEIQNPLNFVNNYSEVSQEMLEELLMERKKAVGLRDDGMETELLQDLNENLAKIQHHGKRAEVIVRGMLEHSRSRRGEPELTDLNQLTEEYVQLAYHGQMAKNKEFEIAVSSDYGAQLPRLVVVPQDIGRVLINLLTNAFLACTERRESILALEGNPEPETYQPRVWVKTLHQGTNIEIRIADNGNGIPEAIKEKIFQPFFTTRPAGQGTGLGLSLAYDIVKAHGGELWAESNNGEGTSMIIRLPVP